MYMLFSCPCQVETRNATSRCHRQSPQRYNLQATVFACGLALSEMINYYDIRESARPYHSFSANIMRKAGGSVIRMVLLSLDW
jgi:hypothetical protein